MNTTKLTVLILAAGYGRRMGPFGRMIPKALIPFLGGREVLSPVSA